jgi:hypothetical protein
MSEKEKKESISNRKVSRAKKRSKRGKKEPPT